MVGVQQALSEPDSGWEAGSSALPRPFQAAAHSILSIKAFSPPIKKLGTAIWKRIAVVYPKHF